MVFAGIKKKNERLGMIIRDFSKMCDVTISLDLISFLKEATAK